MQTIHCTKCGEEAKLQRQIVEYAVKEKDGARVFVLIKTTFTLDCPNCGQLITEVLAPKK